MNKPENITLEQSLQAYRVMNTPTKLSWKQHWAQETFSNNDLLLCDANERKQFEKRLLECPVTIADSIRDPNGGNVCTLSDLVKTLVNPANRNVVKTNRKVIYSTANGKRPTGTEAFALWNGFQVIDMDIKNEELSKALKPHIFEKLYKCNWFLGVALSSSGKGLHIYTKISIPQSDSEDTKKKKLLYLTNFRHKYSFVYLACVSAMDKLGFTKDDVLKWMDLAMFKPQQGAFIGYDPHPLINTHFFEDFIYVNFDNIEDIGSPEIDWVTYPDLKEIFRRWEWFADDDERQDDLKVEVVKADDLEFDTHNKVHYKHHERWRLANTLVKIYGLEKGFKYLRLICSNSVKDKELQADCITASRHAKPVDEWAVNRLNTQHGFKIKLNIQYENFDESKIFNSMNKIDNPNIIRESKYTKDFHLKANEYLGNIRYDILDACGRLTLVEAGPGLGKTEMVKQLVREGKKILMVMPFQSTIKSKVENDKDWYYSYGNRSPRLDVARGLCVTIDKFTHMNLMDIKTSGFDYIFIDESHLMFQSEYRQVMAKAVEMIRNTEVPIILMSGTPSGETVFFPDIVHIRIVKDDNRKKELHVVLVDKPSDLIYVMCKQMAKDVAAGKRILFPTNDGTLYSKQIKAAVSYFLRVDHAIFEDVNLQYYKKSNVGENFMDDVNFKKTIKDVQILLCTSYLSVGVDVLDTYDFEIYFADLFLAGEMDQWANRLRKVDLHINMYVAKNDADGNSRSLQNYKEMNFKLNDEEIKNVHAILRLCNDMIERNPVEYRYNSLVASIISDNKFIEYNEVENKYFLNEISYKLVNFERKYREYAQQLPVIMRGMMAYGYQIDSKDLGGYQQEGAEVFEDAKRFVKLAYDEGLELNTSHIEELIGTETKPGLITEDRLGLYKEVLAGKYDIRKGPEWKEDLSNRKMIVKNIEVFEKVVPICASLSKVYEMDQIRQIFEFCRNANGSFNFAAIGRIRTLTNILYNDKNNRLDLPIKEFMQEAYEFSDLGETTQMELMNFLRTFARKYAMKASSKDIPIQLAALTMEDLYNKFEKIFKCLVKVSRPNKQRKITMERVDILWKWRTDYTDGMKDKIYIIEDFLGVANDASSEDVDVQDSGENPV